MTVLWPTRTARTIAVCRVWALRVTGCHFLAENGRWDLNPRRSLTQPMSAIVVATSALGAALHLRCKTGALIVLLWHPLTLICNV